MKIKTIRQARLLVALLLTWALLWPQAARRPGIVSNHPSCESCSLDDSSNSQGPQAYSTLPANSPEEAWAEFEKADPDGDNKDRLLSSSPLDLGLIAVLIRFRPDRMISLPSPSLVSPHPRC